MDRESKILLRKVLLDFAVLFVVGLPILILYLIGQPYHRGFYCNDESLMYPFKESTVSNNLLYIVGIFYPVLTIVCTEIVIHRHSRGHSTCTFMSHAIPGWIINSYIAIGIFGFGAACSQLTTDIAKYTIGRLRPHFFDVCRPDIDCTKEENQNLYIEQFNCTVNQGTHVLKEVRLSFPSGHSSFSAYTMLFLAMYLQARMNWKGSKLLKHTLQYICLMLSWATAMSRISNYKHHWSDVLSGLIIGIIAAVLTVTYVSDLFPRKTSPETVPLNSSASHIDGKRGETCLPYYNTMQTSHNPAEVAVALHPIPAENN